MTPDDRVTVSPLAERVRAEAQELRRLKRWHGRTLWALTAAWLVVAGLFVACLHGEVDPGWRVLWSLWLFLSAWNFADRRREAMAWR
jgi:uncharacterized membrane protein